MMMERGSTSDNMSWKSVLLVLFGFLLGILLGIGFGIFSVMLEGLMDVGDGFLLYGGLILTILFGLVAENRYLPFVSVLSSFVTYQIMAFYFLGHEYTVGLFWYLPFISVLYGVPWIYLKTVRKPGKKIKSAIKCPNCRNEIERKWVTCPYCGKRIKEETRQYNTRDDTRLYDKNDNTRVY